MKGVITTIALALLCSACGTSARIEKSWRDPDVNVNIAALHKVLVVALLKDETSRRTVEDKLVTYLNGKGVPSYSFLTQNIRKEDEESIRNQVRNGGFDGVVIMRLADVDKDVTYVPGNYPPYYGFYWRYYWRAWNSFYDPGYYRTTKTYTVETNVYSLKSDKLVWSGLTSSVDPANVNKLMNASAKSVYKEMKRQGFLTGV